MAKVNLSKSDVIECAAGIIEDIQTHKLDTPEKFKEYSDAMYADIGRTPKEFINEYRDTMQDMPEFFKVREVAKLNAADPQALVQFYGNGDKSQAMQSIQDTILGAGAFLNAAAGNAPELAANALGANFGKVPGAGGPINLSLLQEPTTMGGKALGLGANIGGMIRNPAATAAQTMVGKGVASSVSKGLSLIKGKPLEAMGSIRQGISNVTGGIAGGMAGAATARVDENPIEMIELHKMRNAALISAAIPAAGAAVRFVKSVGAAKMEPLITKLSTAFSVNPEVISTFRKNMNRVGLHRVLNASKVIQKKQGELLNYSGRTLGDGNNQIVDLGDKFVEKMVRPKMVKKVEELLTTPGGKQNAFLRKFSSSEDIVAYSRLPNWAQKAFAKHTVVQPMTNNNYEPLSFYDELASMGKRVKNDQDKAYNLFRKGSSKGRLDRKELFNDVERTLLSRKKVVVRAETGQLETIGVPKGSEDPGARIIDELGHLRNPEIFGKLGTPNTLTGRNYTIDDFYVKLDEKVKITIRNNALAKDKLFGKVAESSDDALKNVLGDLMPGENLMEPSSEAMKLAKIEYFSNNAKPLHVDDVVRFRDRLQVLIKRNTGTGEIKDYIKVKEQVNSFMARKIPHIKAVNKNTATISTLEDLYGKSFKNWDPELGAKSFYGRAEKELAFLTPDIMATDKSWRYLYGDNIAGLMVPYNMKKSWNMYTQTGQVRDQVRDLGIFQRGTKSVGHMSASIYSNLRIIAQRIASTDIAKNVIKPAYAGAKKGIGDPITSAVNMINPTPGIVRPSGLGSAVSPRVLEQGTDLKDQIKGNIKSVTRIN